MEPETDIERFSYYSCSGPTLASELCRKIFFLQVESNVSEVVVQAPQEDRRTPGVIYTAKQKE